MKSENPEAIKEKHRHICVCKNEKLYMMKGTLSSGLGRFESLNDPSVEVRKQIRGEMVGDDER